MSSLSSNSIETYWSGRLRAATGKVTIANKWLILAIAAGLVGAILTLPALHSRSQQTVISGRIISAQTKAPISDVMVAVDSPPSDDTTFGSYVRTDSDGKFVAEIRGHNVYVKAWKLGYRMNGVDTVDAATLTRQAITIELKELDHSNLAIARSDVYTIKSGSRYSLARGEVVESSSADADITICLDPADNTSVIIESIGDGGIMFQPETESLTYGAASEAPATGYQKRIVRKYWPAQGGFFFVRARDGRHYAKLSLGVPVVDELNGRGHVSLNDGVSFYCTYQPDGSRVLDSNPTKYSFPFFAFGVDPDSLNR